MSVSTGWPPMMTKDPALLGFQSSSTHTQQPASGSLGGEFETIAPPAALPPPVLVPAVLVPVMLPVILVQLWERLSHCGLKVHSLPFQRRPQRAVPAVLITRMS